MSRERQGTAWLIIIDATNGPVTFHHELATAGAAQRFSLPDGKDFVLPQGFRAIVGYDDWAARNKILQVLPIPLTELP